MHVGALVHIEGEARLDIAPSASGAAGHSLAVQRQVNIRPVGLGSAGPIDSVRDVFEGVGSQNPEAPPDLAYR